MSLYFRKILLIQPLKFKIKCGDITDKASVSWLLWLTIVVHYLDSTDSKPHGV